MSQKPPKDPFADRPKVGGQPAANMAEVAFTRDMAIGNIDAIIALAITLANAGLIDRAEYVKNLDFALDQQRQRDGDSHPAARHAVQIVRTFFATPVFQGKPN